mmetsp:Transcript_11964/g.25834  ORF Transcript_11964/g.25834 Transcript_11964/m.25834 type:complete len:519 (+) Transcript_11964:139-1695(+)
MSRPQHSDSAMMMTDPKDFLRSTKPHTAYQVDYSAVNCGRIVAASKRHIQFKYGYTNMDALSSGKTGQDCRGSEHDISVTWSLSSGKQAISYDHQDVLFDVGDSTQTKLSHTWKDALGHTVEVKIHAVNMSAKSNPDPEWKQYDLIVDGVSFFSMPKIFEIGVFPKDNAAATPAFVQGPRKLFGKQQSGAASDAQASSRRKVAIHDMASILPPDEPVKNGPEPVSEVFDLLSFDDFDTPAPVAAAPIAQTAPTQTQYAPVAPAQVQNSYTPASNQAQESYTFAQPPAAAPVQAPGQTNNNAFAIVPAVQQTNTYAPAQQQQQTYAPFNSQTTQDRDDANCISPNTSPGGNSENIYMSPAAPAQDPTSLYSNNAAPSNNAVAPSTSPSYKMQPSPVTPPSNSTALDQPSTVSTTNYGFDGGMKNLVNMDNLFGPTTSAPVTKEAFDVKMEDANGHKSLSQLKGSNTRNANKPIMNTFNSAPVQQNGGYNGYATQQQPQQQQYNNYSYQQSHAQPGFGYQ